MTLTWRQVTARVMLVMTAGVAIIAVPVAAILLVGSPLNPWVGPAWSWTAAGLRIVGALAYLGALSLWLGYGVSRGFNNPFDEVVDSIGRVAIRDFKVRISPFKFKEPHELHKVSAAFNAMAAALQRSEEVRTNLMADVSHELRTPLTVLEGTLRAVLDRVYPLDEAEIANLYAQTRHLIRLVNDLHALALADARQLPLAIQPTDMTVLITDIVQRFAPLAEERGVILRGAPATLPILAVDAVRMQQVLHNLLNNAVRHTPPGGQIRIAGAVEDAVVAISISDTGDGLEPEHLGAVFDRFYRADRSRSRDTGGSGLGLAIVSALIAAHGGTVSATSAGRGQGSCFTIRLPLPANQPTSG